MAPRGLERIDLPPRGEAAVGCLITLHGRGVTGEDLVPIARELDLPRLRYIFPHAPLPFPSTWGGRAWYELPPDDAEGIHQSCRLLTALIEELVADGWAPERIALAGFSQGAVMSLDVGLRYPKRMAGVLALSGYLHAPERLRAERSPEAIGTPILLCHGTEDPLLPIDGSRQAARLLTAEGFSVTLKEYPMGHEVIPEEIAEVKRFLVRIFPEAEPVRAPERRRVS